ncbi:PAS domain S-box-containing protein [Pedobacter sp. UYP24]
MQNIPKHLYPLLQSMGAIVWEANLDMERFNFIGYQESYFLGFPVESWRTVPGFWESRIHPGDISVVAKYLNLSGFPGKAHSFEYRMIRSDENIVWIRDNVCLLSDNYGKAFITGIMLETTAFKRMSLLEKLEERVSAMTLNINISLQELFLTYLSGLEELFPKMRCSILRLKNGRLQNGASPSLPENYMAAIENLEIGEQVGSCGTAAALKKQVIVSDIANDLKWKDYSDLAVRNGLRACWSNPIINADEEVIATLAMYYCEPRSPSEEELQVMERATTLLRGVLENREKTEIIRDANLLMLQSQELAHFGNWNWDIINNVVSWSPALYSIYGLDSNHIKATFEDYLELLHPDDRRRVRETIEKVLQTGIDAEFEERIIRSNGEIRYLRSWAKLNTNQSGKPTKMIGACLDNTEKVRHLKHFKEIAWSQSHVIRAPLSRIMGIIDLIKDTTGDDVLDSKLLDYLLISANELDEQIRTISRRTESLGNKE